MSDLNKPDLRKQIEDLQTQLRQSINQRKIDVQQSYRESRMNKQKELLELNKYKTIIRKSFISQQKYNPDIIEKNKDIYLCKEPLIDDFLKCHIIDPQRNLEKGMIGIKTGKMEKLDGHCFGDIPEEKLSKKERNQLQFWRGQNKKIAAKRYQELLNSQTGIQKKYNQQKRLKELNVFIPNKFIPGYFDEHPSQILSLTQMHQHDKAQVWSPNSFFGNTFDKSFSSKLQEKDQSPAIID